MAKVKAWKVGEAGHPKYPDDFTIVQKAVLQVTDIKTNHNKYYALELHCIGDPAGPPPLNGDHKFRLYTHYGRTDDLETKPDSGQKECRYFRTLASNENSPVRRASRT